MRRPAQRGSPPQITVSVSEPVSWVMFSSSMATEELALPMKRGLSMQGVTALPTIWPWMAVPSTVPSTSTVIPGRRSQQDSAQP